MESYQHQWLVNHYSMEYVTILVYITILSMENYEHPAATSPRDSTMIFPWKASVIPFGNQTWCAEKWTIYTISIGDVPN